MVEHKNEEKKTTQKCTCVYLPESEGLNDPLNKVTYRSCPIHGKEMGES
jgi:hypothetical protein